MMGREKMLEEVVEILETLKSKEISVLIKQKSIRKLKRIEKSIETRHLELYNFGWLHIKPEDIPKGYELEFLIFVHKYGEAKSLDTHDLRRKNWSEWMEKRFPYYYKIFLQYSEDWEFVQIPLDTVVGIKPYHEDWDYS